MRTIIKFMAICMSCILLGSVNVQGMEKTLRVEKTAEKHPYFDEMWDYTDSHYGYVSYGWKRGNYIRHTIKDGKFQSKKIRLGEKARKYAKKRDTGCEWTDAKGNFYFLSSHGKNKYVGVLNKVDKKGRLVKRISLNKWLKVTQESNSHYALFIERVEGQEVVASYYDYKKSGYVILDRNSGKVKRQIIYSGDALDELDGGIYCYQKTMLFGKTSEGKLLCGTIPSGKKITLPSGNKIRYQKVKKFKTGDELPRKAESIYGIDFAVLKNRVYVLTSAGYYRINTEDLSLEKLASTERIPFWKTESEYPVNIELMVLSNKKFIIKQCYRVDGEEDIREYTFWQGIVS